MTGAGALRWVFWIGVVAALVVALQLLSAILLPFAAGFAIAYFLAPAVARLERLKVPRGLGTLIALLAFLTAIVLVLLVIVPLLEAQLAELVRRVPRVVEAARRELEVVMGLLQERLAPDDFQKLRDAAGARVGDAVAWAGKVLQSLLTSGFALFNVISLVFITPIVAFFLLRDWKGIVAEVDSWLPLSSAPTIRAQALLVDETLAGFIRGQATVSILMAAVYATLYSIVGLDFGLVLGLISGLLTAVPFLGGVLAVSLVTLTALGQFDSLAQVGVVALIAFVGQTVEGNFITPKLVGDRVRLHPVWIIFALLAFGNLFGLVGLLIAVPAAATIGVLARFALQRYRASHLYDPALTPPPPPVAPAEATAVAPARSRDDAPAGL